jgi:hypothetical protein
MRNLLLLPILCLSFQANCQTPGSIYYNALGVEIRVTVGGCSGQLTGSIRLALINGIPPVTYQYTGPGNSGNGVMDNIDPIELLNNIPFGIYVFTLTNGVGTDTTLQIPVAEPAALAGSIDIPTNYHGYNISCAGGDDGMALIVPAGGFPPYTYKWSTGATTPLVDGLGAKLYKVTITDYYHCTAVISTTLTEPPPIVADVYAKGDKCFAENSGVIDIKSITGGISPYLTILNNGLPTAQRIWDQLAPGSYFLSIVDANGCEKQEGVILPTGLMFVLEAGPDSSMYSGDTLRYHLKSNLVLASTQWTPAAYASTTDPNEVAFFPYFSTTFTVHAVDTNGCIATDQVFIRVHRNRDVYIPNAFSPEGSLADNHTLTVYGSGGIDAVEIFQVFDRFGRKWFEGRHFPVNAPQLGWTGQDGGDKAYPGVYIYYARVRYTDGRVETFTGDVTLIR